MGVCLYIYKWLGFASKSNNDTVLSQARASGKVHKRALVANPSRTVRSKFSLSKELSKICTGRCHVLRGSDTERHGIQCVPNQNSHANFEWARIIRKDNQQSKKDTQSSVLFALLVNCNIGVSNNKN